jgi:hypothetical protein
MKLMDFNNSTGTIKHTILGECQKHMFLEIYRVIDIRMLSYGSKFWTLTEEEMRRMETRIENDG